MALRHRKKAAEGKAKSSRGYATPEDTEVPAAEKRAVGKLLGQISRAKTLNKQFFETTLKRVRRYQWGTLHAEQGNTETTTRTNLIYATQATLLPHIYAKNPEMAVAPTEAVQPSEYEKIKAFAKTAEVMLSRCVVKEARLKQRCKSNVRSAMNTSVGWMKLTFQESITGDPIILRRHNDLQDNLRRIEHLIKRRSEEHDPDQLAEEAEEIRQQIEKVKADDEVTIYKGFALDRVQTEDMLILDESIVDFYDYVDAGALGMGKWMTDDEYCETFGSKPFKNATSFGVPSIEKEDDAGAPVQFGEADAKQTYRRVWEIWNKKKGMVFTVCEGAPGYCRPPYVPKPTPARWYPFYCLGFNIVEGRWRPIADTELLWRLQDEYGTTRYFYAEARKEAVPVRVYRKSGELTDEDIQNLKNRKARQWIGVDGNPSVPLNQDIMQLEGVKISPEDFDVTVIRNDMDMLVGLSDASRANLIQAKTATEAEIMRQSLMNRVAERQDTNEDLISELGESALQVMLQKFTRDEVSEIVGEGAEWYDPGELSLEEIFQKIDVSVRAGSTGKPNQLKERESWTAIMPILKETIAQVTELRAAGQHDMANALIELLKETLTRYDERIDVDRFIPRPKLDANGQPVEVAKAMAELPVLKQKMMELEQALAECQAELQKAQQGDQSKAADIQAKQAIATAQESAKAAEAEKAKHVEATAAAAKEVEETKRHEADLAAEAAKHERELKYKRECELIKIAGQIVSAGLTADKSAAEGEAKTVRADFDTLVEQLTGFLTEMTADTVADYEGDQLRGVRRVPGAAPMGETGIDRLLSTLSVLTRPQVPTYDGDGRIVRVSRAPA